MFVTGKGGLVTAFLLAVSLVLGACAPKAAAPSAEKEAAPAAVGEAVRGGVLQLAGPQYRSFDFQQETHTQTTTPVGPAYSTILQPDPFDPWEKSIIPDLAERWEQSSPTTYVFHFRKDVKWHDGAPFTAEDAKFTLERITNPPKGIISHRKDWLRQIDKLDLMDPYTLRISLKQPQASFLSFLAESRTVVVPKHSVENDQEFLRRNIMGTGPFKVKNIDFNVGVELERNPEYFKKGLPYLGGVRYTIMDASPQFAAFRTGRLDLRSLDPQQRDTILKEIPGVQIFQTPGLGSNHIRFNHTKPPFNNLKVRQAMSLAVDRQAIIHALAFGEGYLPFCGLPVGGGWDIPQEELIKLPGYRPDKTDDLKRAKELLAEAGYPNGFKATMLLGQSDAGDNNGLMVKDQVRAIGIELETRKLEFTSFITAIDRLEFEILPYGLGSGVNDPDDLLPIQYKTGGGRNYGKFSDPEVDRLIDSQTREFDPEKRKKLAQEACLKAAVENVAQLEIRQSLSTKALQPWVKGHIPHIPGQSNFKHENTWIDPSLKR